MKLGIVSIIRSSSRANNLPIQDIKVRLSEASVCDQDCRRSPRQSKATRAIGLLRRERLVLMEILPATAGVQLQAKAKGKTKSLVDSSVARVVTGERPDGAPEPVDLLEWRRVEEGGR